MKYQNLFFGKKKKNIFICRLLKSFFFFFFFFFLVDKKATYLELCGLHGFYVFYNLCIVEPQ